MNHRFRGLFLMLTVTAACDAINPTPPWITPHAVAVTGASAQGLSLRVDLSVRHGNRVSVTVRSVDVRVSLAGRDLGMSHFAQPVRLPPDEDVPMSVQVTAAWGDLPGIVVATALNEQVPYHLDGTAHVKAGYFTLDVPFSVDSTMPRSVLTSALSNSFPSIGR